MSPPRSNTKDAILDTAESLLQERGFNAFSYQHISEQLGVKNAAIHYHFPNKAGLGVAVIERYNRNFHDWVARHQQRGTKPLAMLRGYFAIPLRFMRDGQKACPLGVLEAEFGAIPDPMRDAVRTLDADIRGFLSEALEQGRQQAVFQFNGTAQDKALLVVSALQGALQISRAAGTKAFMTVIRQIERDLGVEEQRDKISSQSLLVSR